MKREKMTVQAGKSSRYRRKEITAAYLFIAPQIIGLTLFVLVPVSYTHLAPDLDISLICRKDGGLWIFVVVNKGLNDNGGS